MGGQFGFLEDSLTLQPRLALKPMAVPLTLSKHTHLTLPLVRMIT